MYQKSCTQHFQPPVLFWFFYRFCTDCCWRAVCFLHQGRGNPGEDHCYGRLLLLQPPTEAHNTLPRWTHCFVSLHTMCVAVTLSERQRLKYHESKGWLVRRGPHPQLAAVNWIIKKIYNLWGKIFRVMEGRHFGILSSPQICMLSWCGDFTPQLIIMCCDYFRKENTC